jgi:hypothetical protein
MNGPRTNSFQHPNAPARSDGVKTSHKQSWQSVAQTNENFTTVFWIQAHDHVRDVFLSIIRKMELSDFRIFSSNDVYTRTLEF